jgi:hypothetical protein
MAFPGTYNFNYYKGDTFEFSIYPKTATSEPFDLTGFEVVFTVSTERGVAGESFRVESYAEIDVDHINCAILPAQSALWSASDTYEYDVEISNSSGEYPKVYTVLTGRITVTDQVSATPGGE